MRSSASTSGGNATTIMVITPDGQDPPQIPDGKHCEEALLPWGVIKDESLEQKLHEGWSLPPQRA